MLNRFINSANVHMHDVGEVRFLRNFRAKRITISIRPFSGIRVTVPGILSLENAKAFVLQKKKWIIEKQKFISDVEINTIKPNNFCTKEHILKYSPEATKKIFFNLRGSEIIVKYPKEIDSSHPSVQQVTRKAIEQAYRKESFAYLPLNVERLANQHGFKYNALRIKNITSRWGSCSSKNNINLSIYLMKLPNELIDYIILHELTHTIHKNHGPEFWNHLNSLTGNAKALAARVKKYRTGV